LSQTAFSTLKLDAVLLENIASLGYTEMTPIQAQSLPHILEGKDVIGQGKSGSGKTAAFALGVLAMLDVKRKSIQALVLCPTRELADQVANEIRRLARTTQNIKVLSLCGGMPFKAQSDSLKSGAHIVVGTPGRINDHLLKSTLKLSDVCMLVLDEADRMLAMGFQPALDAIIEKIPKKRQTLLFSATYPVQIESIARRVMIKPIMTKVESLHDSTTIQQHFYRVDANEQRIVALRLILSQASTESTVIFCNTKLDVQALADDLRRLGYSVLALHGDLEQRDREQTLVRFTNKSVAILVATDVASRGLDIDALDCVINYHIATDPEVHIHRIGRTGRAGNTGVAHSIYTRKESHKIEMLGEYLDQIIESETLPSPGSIKKSITKPAMACIQIDCRKKQKVRAGDILGALTGEYGIAGNQVGKINIFDYCAYVAVNRDVVKLALKKLAEGKLKGRTFKSRLIS
jgi:ATP-independent RNA helicase DbpA